MSGFDLSEAAAVAAKEDEGTVVHVRGSDGEPMYFGKDDAEPVTITVAGTYSKAYRRAVDAQRERLVKQRRVTLTGEALAKQQLELVAACVLAWSGIVDAGKPLPCEKPNVLRLLTAAPWIREQVEEAMQDHAGFFGSSSTD